jgi:Carboxypeptidase regulatory-like domain
MISDRYQGNKLITELHHLAFDYEACSGILQQVLLTLLFLLASSFAGHAQQTTGSISGLVTDPSGAAVPGVTVTAINTATGTATKVTSNGDGVYRFVTLPTGGYNISAEKVGFKSTDLSGIDLQVYQKAVVNITLSVGDTTQTVLVQSSTPLVDPSTSSLGTVVNEQAIQDLPLNLREVGALALTVPGTVDTTGRSLSSENGNGSGFATTSYAGAGGASGGNLLLIDGMISRSLNNGSFALNPPPDFVQEFKIQNNVYDAAFGMTSGTVMNLVTQSGTNKIHGSAWEYLRNRDLDAREYTQTVANSPEKPEYIRNQFGGSMGGPILKDKLFLFGAYEGLRQTQAANVQNAVPSVAQKQGDFSGLLSGTTQNLCGEGGPANLVYDTGQLFDPKTVSTYTCPNSGSSILVGTAIPNNNVATYLGGTANFDPVAQKVLPLFHDPVAGSVFYLNPANAKDDRNQYQGRLDYNLSQKDLIFGRYLLGAADQLFPGPFNPFNSVQHFRGHNAVVGWTHTFGPTLINDARAGYQGDYLKYSCQSCPRPAGTIENFGIADLAASVPEFEEYPNFTFSNFPALGDGFPGYFPDVIPDQIFKYEDTVTKTLKRHTLNFGFDLNFWNTKGVSDPIHANGEISFNGQYSDLGAESSNATTASDLADLELGSPNMGQYTKGAFVTNLVGGRWISLFAQDNFRATSRLTIEAGLRWEYRKLPVDTNNQVAALYPLSKSYTPGDALLLSAFPAAQNDALCSQAYYISPATGNCVLASSTQRAALGFTGNKLRELSFGPGHGAFAPRLAFSVRPLDSDRLIFHIGVGAFFDLPVSNPLGSYVNNNPISTQTPTYSQPFGAPPPSNGSGGIVTTANIFLASTTPNLSQINSQMLPSPFYHTPTIWEWSGSTQYQALRNTAVEVAYIGNRGYHEDFNHQVGNQAKPNTASTQAQLQAFRPWPDFNTITYDSYDAYSNYNAMTVKVTQRISHGLSGLIAYAYSKGMDDDGGTTDGGAINANLAPQDDNNPASNYGVSDTSIRHRLVVSGIYQLPVGRGRRFLNSSNSLVNAVAGGWDISAIVQAQSGYPFSVLSTNDFSNTGSPSPKPDRTCSGKGPRTKAEWFNVSCFPTAALAADLANGTPRFGDSGRNILTGPRFTDVDTSLIKRFSIFEGVRVEFRGEFFNLFNHPNLGIGEGGIPNNYIGSNLVGQITNTTPAANSREIQLGLKVIF